jgi:hypothetical protein
MWALKLTIVFVATFTNGYTTITQSVTKEVFDEVKYSDEQSCQLAAQWWMSAAASPTGAVKNAECLPEKHRPGKR